MMNLLKRLKDGWKPASQGAALVLPPEGDEELPAAVFVSELAAIAERRAATGLPPVEGYTPTARLGLVGLAFSGGGIRSATFNLGVAQALQKRGLWRFVDYLSTVSGGGYIGSAISSLYAGGNSDLTVDDMLNDVPEGAAVRHLRNNSNYLLPKKFLARLRLPGLFLRGLLVNLLIILPVVALAALTTVWVAGEATREASMTTELTVQVDPDGHSRWLVAGEGNRFRRYMDLSGSVRAYAVNDDLPVPDRVAVLKPPVGIAVGADKTRSELVLPIDEAGRIPVTFIPAFDGVATLEVRAWRDAPEADPVDLKVDPVTQLHELCLGWLGMAVSLVLAVLALYPVAQWIAEWGHTPSWKSRDLFSRYVGGGVLLALAAAVFVSIQPLAIYYFDLLGEYSVPGVGDLSETLTLLGGSGTGLAALFSGPLSRKMQSAARRLSLLIFSALGPLTLWLLYLTLARWIIVPETAPVWLLAVAAGVSSWLSDGVLASVALSVSDGLRQVFGVISDRWIWPEATQHMAASCFLAAIVVAVVTRLFYDVNATSFHRFYRDRLSLAYLIDPSQVKARKRFQQADELKLSALSTQAPYHLVNTTLNLQGSSRPSLRGRNAAFFVMSRNFIGGQLTGYRPTADMEALHPALDLGTAMAISGAAAAPNMGRATHKGLTLALTLLNVRLGYWLPHPRMFAASFYRDSAAGRLLRRVATPFIRATPWHLVLEMMGKLDDKGRQLNLSDGGHLENLGLYELLRRRCRLIIVSDAEADPNMIFQGLADALRLARIDLGVKVDIDIDAIRPDANGLSKKHGAVGVIQYGNGETGQLIYIKSSLTGDENVYVEKYKSLDATFPHQTTADQFFDEEQFEAYRALGLHAAESVLKSAESVIDL